MDIKHGGIPMILSMNITVLKYMGLVGVSLKQTHTHTFVKHCPTSYYFGGHLVIGFVVIVFCETFKVMTCSVWSARNFLIFPSHIGIVW